MFVCWYCRNSVKDYFRNDRSDVQQLKQLIDRIDGNIAFLAENYRLIRQYSGITIYDIRITNSK